MNEILLTNFAVLGTKKLRIFINKVIETTLTTYCVYTQSNCCIASSLFK